MALRKLAVAGAYPLGMTDCLNFPSPEVPENFWIITEVVKGMALACKELNCPIVSGNVSLYNESHEDAILPTPVVCAIGAFEGKNFLKGKGPEPSDKLFLIGKEVSLNASAYRRYIEGKIAGPVNPVNFDDERAFIEKAIKTAALKLATCGRCVSLGGIALTAMKMVSGSRFGLEIMKRDIEFLFGEGGPRALYSVPENKTSEFLKVWEDFPVKEIGKVVEDKTVRFVS